MAATSDGGTTEREAFVRRLRREPGQWWFHVATADELCDAFRDTGGNGALFIEEHTVCGLPDMQPGHVYMPLELLAAVAQVFTQADGKSDMPALLTAMFARRELAWDDMPTGGAAVHTPSAVTSIRHSVSQLARLVLLSSKIVPAHRLGILSDVHGALQAELIASLRLLGVSLDSFVESDANAQILAHLAAPSTPAAAAQAKDLVAWMHLRQTLAHQVAKRIGPLGSWIHWTHLLYPRRQRTAQMAAAQFVEARRASKWPPSSPLGRVVVTMRAKNDPCSNSECE